MYQNFGGSPSCSRSRPLPPLLAVLEELPQPAQEDRPAPAFGQLLPDGVGFLVLGLEEKREEVKRHYRSLGVAGDAELYVFVELPPPDAMERVAASVKQRKPVLVVVDGLYRLLRVTDENGYAEVSRKLEPLLGLARESGSHVLVTHHENKRALGLDDQDGVLGSTALVGSVDCTEIIRRQRETNRRTVLSTQRYGQDLEETVLALDETGRVYLAGSKADAEVHDAEANIVQALEAAGEPIPEKSTDVEEPSLPLLGPDCGFPGSHRYTGT